MRRLPPGECLGLVLAEGSGLNLKFGQTPSALQQLAGLRPMPSLNRDRAYAALLNSALTTVAHRLGARIARRWQATGRTGANVHYVGVVLEAS